MIEGYFWATCPAYPATDVNLYSGEKLEDFDAYCIVFVRRLSNGYYAVLDHPPSVRRNGGRAFVPDDAPNFDTLDQAQLYLETLVRLGHAEL